MRTPLYAVLSVSSSRNIGDHIQSIAARRFLPRADLVADRDHLNHFMPDQPCRLICNGWFANTPHRLGFSPHVRPLLISMHLSERAWLPDGAEPLSFGDALRAVPELRAELARFAPVGARDLPTLRLLQDLGIESWFSGCLTLALERAHDQPRGDQIVACDLPAEVSARLGHITGQPVLSVTHQLPPGADWDEGMVEAERLLRVYQSAALVVTTRLHAALPCLAYGTPVLLLDRGFESERFDGLSAFLACRPLAGAETRSAGDLPPAAPATGHLALRQQISETIRHFIARPALDDAASTGDPLALAQALTDFYAQESSRLRGALRAAQQSHG